MSPKGLQVSKHGQALRGRWSPSSAKCIACHRDIDGECALTFYEGSLSFNGGATMCITCARAVGPLVAAAEAGMKARGEPVPPVVAPVTCQACNHLPSEYSCGACELNLCLDCATKQTGCTAIVEGLGSPHIIR